MRLNFTSISNCGRSVKEQRYIWAQMQIWDRLPMERKNAVRALIGRIARTPEEGRSLFDVAVRGLTPQIASMRSGVTLMRVYDLRREFYERFVI